MNWVSSPGVMATGNYFSGADPEDGDGDDCEDKVHQRGVGGLDLGCEDVFVCELDGTLIELAAFEVFTGEGLDDSGAGEVLLQIGAHAAAHVLDVAPDDPEPGGRRRWLGRRRGARRPGK